MPTSEEIKQHLETLRGKRRQAEAFALSAEKLFSSGENPIEFRGKPYSETRPINGCVLTRSVHYEGKFQITYFDDDGFSSDESVKPEKLNDELQGLFIHGYHVHTPTDGPTLDELASTQRFQDGIERSLLVMRWNNHPEERTFA